MEKLQRLDTLQLIDVLKNYQQYGYDESVRNSTIEVLESRGVTMEELKATGNFEPNAFETAQEEELREVKSELLYRAIQIGLPLGNIALHLLLGKSAASSNLVITFHVASAVAFIWLLFRRI